MSTLYSPSIILIIFTLIRPQIIYKNTWHVHKIHSFWNSIEIYHACKWYLQKNTGFETRQISLASYWLRDWTNFPSRRQARDICLVSKPVFFGKYHLQAWYISIIPRICGYHYLKINPESIGM